MSMSMSITLTSHKSQVTSHKSCPRTQDLGVLVDEALQTDFADGEKKEEKTSKRVANFKKQVEKGVRDMKVMVLNL